MEKFSTIAAAFSRLSILAKDTSNSAGRFAKLLLGSKFGTVAGPTPSMDGWAQDVKSDFELALSFVRIMGMTRERVSARLRAQSNGFYVNQRALRRYSIAKKKEMFSHSGTAPIGARITNVSEALREKLWKDRNLSEAGRQIKQKLHMVRSSQHIHLLPTYYYYVTRNKLE